MNNISTICMNHYYFRGFAPSPTSFFVFRARLKVVRAGKKRTKQENSSSAYIEIPAGRQNDRHRALLQRRNFRQSGISLLAEISYVAAFTPSAAPRFGGATARCLEPASPQCVRSKRTIPYSDGFPFKRRRSPLICTLMSAG
jgi:hypothetical protein